MLGRPQRGGHQSKDGGRKPTGTRCTPPGRDDAQTHENLERNDSLQRDCCTQIPKLEDLEQASTAAVQDRSDREAGDTRHDRDRLQRVGRREADHRERPEGEDAVARPTGRCDHAASPRITAQPKKTP